MLFRRFFLGICVIGLAFSAMGAERDLAFLKQNKINSELRIAMLAGEMDSGKSVPAMKMKSPKKGLLFSAVVPGAGQLYGGSWIKSALFLGVEVGCWVGYMNLQDEGEKIEDEFHLYADTHWSEERWRATMQPSDPATHNLPPTKTQQYYEMIGKYDQFKRGWDDYSESGPDLTPNRNTYETMRDDSNQKYITASRLAMVILANHVLSGLEAAWSINRHNVKAKAQVHMQPKQGDANYATVGMVLNW